MIPEIGALSLNLALALAVLLSIVPLYGSFVNDERSMRMAASTSFGLFALVLISFVVLSYAFATDDFSVKYVATNSNSLLPIQYKFSAVWGGHEGSLLLWVLILASWTWAVALFSKALPLLVKARVLSVMGMVNVGFLLFTIATSNPFERLFPIPPEDGRDLNPLLQDFGLIVHPPMLYLGYVGFSVAFAFAITALIGGKLDAAWARWARPWTTMAWVFLTAGIALGSWWAYYELGWGGWWFWDPVENASFMPWLVGTALMHSLAVTEKRGAFKSWTLLLAIFAFSLSLLGAFLVRSGVLTSVHAFASDPERGMFLLLFLCVVVGGSLLLYAFRAPATASTAVFGWLSREMFLLINNLLLVVAMLVVILGTLFPLAADALGMGKYSVGPPYFNALFVPLMAILMVFLAVGPMVNWKKTRGRQLMHSLLVPAVACVAVGLVMPFITGDSYNISIMLVSVLGFWVLFTMMADLYRKLQRASSITVGLRKLSASYWGMQCGHLGMVICAFGVVFVSQYDSQRDIRMEPGDSATLAQYEFIFDGAKGVKGPNYVADQGSIEVKKDGQTVTTLFPERRRYHSSPQIMTEAGIDAALPRDVYVALGEHRGGDAWAVRLQVKPLVRWIWLGAIFMAVGGILAAMDKRYRKQGVKA